MIKKVTCSVKRGPLEESQHKINCVVINQNNKILFQSGDINKSYCLRSTLKPFQCAASLECGTDKKYKLSQKEIAKRVGKSRSVIANSLRLLNLPNSIKNDIKENL